MKYMLVYFIAIVSMNASAAAEVNKNEPVMVTVSQSQYSTSDTASQKAVPARNTSSFAPQKISQHNSTANQDFWIYDSWLTLVKDEDYDGYYSFFSLSFDVDTFYQAHELYAVIYLGDAVTYKSVYVTSVFTVYGQSSDDYLTLDIELISGYLPYDYDIRIELYDAHNDTRVSTYDSFNDADLSFVSLESRTNDDPYHEAHHDTHHDSSRSGGSIGIAALVLLIVAFARRCTTLIL